MKGYNTETTGTCRRLSLQPRVNMPFVNPLRSSGYPGHLVMLVLHTQKLAFSREEVFTQSASRPGCIMWPRPANQTPQEASGRSKEASWLGTSRNLLGPPLFCWSLEGQGRCGPGTGGRFLKERVGCGNVPFIEVRDLFPHHSQTLCERLTVSHKFLCCLN